ncbi:hypothetical protein GUJ93_ZPchr0010g10576 [Zizania palustris]|uniref:Uncharacterized protein n=1 Tax=Zizania palustris TaxID=103762 RepID=A0A8J6BIA4_ZIZPA|nr:hypothetical protein GUJ93_ZPchr0010g10576 [Zizania palustris]
MRQRHKFDSRGIDPRCGDANPMAGFNLVASPSAPSTPLSSILMELFGVQTMPNLMRRMPQSYMASCLPWRPPLAASSPNRQLGSALTTMVEIHFLLLSFAPILNDLVSSMFFYI